MPREGYSINGERERKWVPDLDIRNPFYMLSDIPMIFSSSRALSI